MKIPALRVALLLVAGVVAVWVTNAREGREAPRGSVRVVTLDPAAEKSGGTTLGPGDGIELYRHYHVSTDTDVPGLRVQVSVPDVHARVGDVNGFISVCVDGEAAAQNIPVPSSTAFPYEGLSVSLARRFDRAPRASTASAGIRWEPVAVTTTDCSTIAEVDFVVARRDFAVGGPAPGGAFAPDDDDAWFPDFSEAGPNFIVTQTGHGVPLETARNQDLSAGIAHEFEYLTQTTGFVSPHPNIAGLADDSLVAQLDTAMGRRTDPGGDRGNAVTNKTTSIERVPGATDIVIENAGADERANYRDRHYYSPFHSSRPLMFDDDDEGDFRSYSIAPVIDGLGRNQPVTIVTAGDGGSRTSSVLAAGRTNYQHWFYRCADTNQLDDDDDGASFLNCEVNYLTDPDRNGRPNLSGTSEEIVYFRMAQYQDSTSDGFETLIKDIIDPLGHDCCVFRPGPNATVERTGSQIVIHNTGDGFPLTGTIHANRTVVASNVSSVAGFPNVETVFRGSWNGGWLSGEHRVGENGELFGEPIKYVLNYRPPTVRITTDLIIDPGDSYHVRAGQELALYYGAGIYNDGALYNEGTIVVPAGSTVRNGGVWSGKGNVTVEESGLLTNAGSLAADSLQAFGTVDTYGDLWLDRLTVDGTFVASNGNRTVTDVAHATVGGSAEFGGTTRVGTLDLTGGGSATNSGWLGNSGRLDIGAGSFTNDGTTYNICRGRTFGVPGGDLDRIYVTPCQFAAHPSSQEQYYVDIASSASGRFRLDLDMGTDGNTPTEARIRLELRGVDLDGSATPSDPTDDVTGIHIHNAPREQTGPAVFGILNPSTIVDTIRGTVSTTWTGSSLQGAIDDLFDGNLYVNVHTSAFPAGEIRGQIVGTFGCDEERTYCSDGDGDGDGDPGSSRTACTPPTGYTLACGDCDDTNVRVSSDAQEINDAVDNQCSGNLGFGAVDEISGATSWLDASTFAWIGQPGATAYEIARSSTPDFASCTISTSPSTTASVPGTPGAGVTWYIVVRSTAPNQGAWGVGRGSFCP